MRSCVPPRRVRWCSRRPRSVLGARRSPPVRWPWCAPSPLAAPVPVSWCFRRRPVPLVCRRRRQPPPVSAGWVPARGPPPRSRLGWACRSWFSLAVSRRSRPGALGCPLPLPGCGRAGSCRGDPCPCSFAAALRGRFFLAKLQKIIFLGLYFITKKVIILVVVRLFFQWFQVFAAASKLAKTETRLSQGFSASKPRPFDCELGANEARNSVCQGLNARTAKDGIPNTTGRIVNERALHLFNQRRCFRYSEGA